MAIAQGKKSEDVSAGYSLYTGVGTFNVIGVNPTKEQMNKLYGREFEKEPEYFTETDDKIKKVRIDFILKSVDDGVDLISKVSYFLEQRPETNKDGTKVKVINAYGETTWATKEQLQSKKLADNMSWYNTEGMRWAYVGEDNLTKFIKAFLAIPDRTYRKDGVTHEIKDPATALVQFENVKSFFTGDIKEVISAIKISPDNKVKLFCGVKTSTENKQYQAFASDFPMKFGVSRYNWYWDGLQDRQNNGAYPEVEFGGMTLISAYELKPSSPVAAENNQSIAQADFFSGNAGSPVVETNFFDGGIIPGDDLPF